MQVYHDFFLVPGSRSTFPDTDPDPDPDPKHWFKPYIVYWHLSIYLSIYLSIFLQRQVNIWGVQLHDDLMHKSFNFFILFGLFTWNATYFLYGTLLNTVRVWYKFN